MELSKIFYILYQMSYKGYKISYIVLRSLIYLFRYLISYYKMSHILYKKSAFPLNIHLYFSAVLAWVWRSVGVFFLNPFVVLNRAVFSFVFCQVFLMLANLL